MPTDAPGRGPAYPLYFPPELRPRLEQAARRSHRSLHAEILHRLEASFDPAVALVSPEPDEELHRRPRTPELD